MNPVRTDSIEGTDRHKEARFGVKLLCVFIFLKEDRRIRSRFICRLKIGISTFIFRGEKVADEDIVFKDGVLEKGGDEKANRHGLTIPLKDERDILKGGDVGLTF